MDQKRFEQALQTLSELDGDVGARVIENLKDIAPDLGRYVIEHFADFYSRPGLDLKSREIATVAALTALGNAQPQLKLHINGALNAGWSREEVVEVIMQMAFFAGFPTVLKAIPLAREVFMERDAKGVK
jgi:4-carboxymuconolactone decarboxylase